MGATEFKSLTSFQEAYSGCVRPFGFRASLAGATPPPAIFPPPALSSLPAWPPFLSDTLGSPGSDELLRYPVPSSALLLGRLRAEVHPPLWSRPLCHASRPAQATPFGLAPPLTGLGVHGEVMLAIQHAVHQSSAAAIRGVIRIRGHHLHHRCAWARGTKRDRGQLAPLCSSSPPLPTHEKLGKETEAGGH